MGNAASENLTPIELRYKSVHQNTYVDGIPVGCYAASDKSVLQNLIDMGYDFNVSDKNKKTPYHYAIDFEDTFNMLLGTNASFSKDSNGNTPLHDAVTKNKINLIKYMSCCIFEQNNEGDTPLHLAVKNNNNKLFLHLFEHTPMLSILQKFNTSDNNKQYVLHNVFNNENESVLELIIKYKNKELLNYVAPHTSMERSKSILAKAGASDYKNTVDLMQCLVSK